ncbi:MAG TPA: hypothetical protein VGM37_16975 [Armatimonadota bacterium]|jgi:hypothetical protein
MRPSVVRIHDDVSDDLTERNIFGLNALLYNGVEAPDAQDPRIVFLNALITGHNVAAHTGNFAGDANIAAEEFGPPTPENPYVTTRQNLYNGDFWQEAAGRPPAFLFPHARRPFLGLEPTDFEYLIRCGNIALYVGVDPVDEAALLNLAADPPREPTAADVPGERWELQNARNRVWLEAVTRLCRVAVVTGHDGQDFQCYAWDAADFRLLDDALTAGVEAVTGMEWYRSHADQLVWNAHMDLCLMLPENIDADRRTAERDEPEFRTEEWPPSA